MDCREVKRIMQLYIDDEIDRDMKNAFRLHIESCENCRIEFDKLLAYKSEMGSLKRINAPVSFLDEIHERIEKPPLMKRLTERLFLPVKIKLPLEAAGVLAIVLIVFFLYSPMESLKRKIQPVSEDRDITAEYELEDMAEQAIEESGRSFSRKPARFDGRALRKAMEKRTEGAKTGASQMKEKNSGSPADASVTYELALLIPSASSAAPLPAAPPEKAVNIADSGEMGSVQGAGAAKDSGETPETERGLVERKKSLEMEDESLKDEAKADASPVSGKSSLYEHTPAPVQGELRRIASSFGGEIIKEESSPGTGEAEYIILLIPAENYPGFLKEIKNIGILEEKRPPAAAVNKGKLRIKIEIARE